MIQSIQQFQTEGVKNLEKVFINYSSDMTKIAEMVKGVTDCVIKLGLLMIAEELEMYDTFLREHKHARITEDAEAKILEEAVQTSYRRGGLSASITEECVSKETVMNKLHALEFPKNTEKPKEKKVVEYLYIDADEDHVSLQFREKKGDLIKTENNRKNNNAIAKLVYIYEGIEKEAPLSM